MGLRIANNISAMTTRRWLGVADSGLSKSLERLSSGYRINKAADDAAGLAISQSFRADIASFKVASRNTSEATSLLQVAEGAMDQIGSMLTRLKELATQAASGNAGSDIAKISSEANQLISEIDRIANSTEYADTALLTGNLGVSSMAGAVSGTASNGDVTVLAENSNWLSIDTGTGMTGSVSSVISGTIDSSIANLVDSENIWTLNNDGTATGVTLNNGAITLAGVLATGAGALTLTITGMGNDGGNLVLGLGATIATGDLSGSASDIITLRDTGLSNTVTVGSDAVTGSYTFSTSGSNILLTGPGGINESEAGTASASIDFDALGITIATGAEWDTGDLDSMVITVSGSTGTSMDFQVGAENDTNNRLSVNIDSTTASDLTLTNGMLLTQAAAQTALTTIDAAISTLSTNRGNVGGYMNRLSYASANLSATIENVQAAESVIRDVDMASEMTQFTKNQILLQAGTAMLAQANMAPQQVLALFG